MPIMLQQHGRNHLTKLQEQRITKMTMAQLIVYEAVLWQWMDKLDRSKMRSESIVNQLNAIHREVEWRAMDKEWADATHS
jgi:hypothetical protein